MPSFETKLSFLQALATPEGEAARPDCVETHMSWLFFVGPRVFKLKKPVRFPFLDFSTLEAREFNCREELRLNARLAPDVYLGLLALQDDHGSLALVPEEQLPAAGRTVDWLVHMRRLPAERSLQHLVQQGTVERADIDALAAVLAKFYRRAARVPIDAQEYLGRFQRTQAVNREVLMRPQFDLQGAAAALDRLDAALLQQSALLHERVAQGHVVDGHGDLRPEHVWLLRPPVLIDCLEFNATLRQVDPFDEIALLGMECALAGAGWIGHRLAGRCALALGDAPSPALMHLYTAQRALLRARLAMAHLLDPQPRTPQRWPLQAQRYVAHALAALDALDALAHAAADHSAEWH